MATEKHLTGNQSRSDVRLGLQCFEEWKEIARCYRLRIDEAYGPAFKLVLQNLISLSEAGTGMLQKYLEEFHPDPPPESPDGKLLRPDVPEWRPGANVTSSSD